MPSSRRCRLRTITGSNEPSRSRAPRSPPDPPQSAPSSPGPVRTTSVD